MSSHSTALRKVKVIFYKMSDRRPIVNNQRSLSYIYYTFSGHVRVAINYSRN